MPSSTPPTAVLGCALIALAACASSPPVHFLTLDAVAPSAAMPPQAAAPPVRVAAVHLPAALDRQELVTESSPNHLVVSDQSRWGAPLADLLRGVLTQDLLARLPAAEVISPQQPVLPHAQDLVVDFLQFGGEPSAEVTAEGSWVLLEPSSGTLLERQGFRFTVRSDQSDAAQAAALSTLVGRLADEIARALAARTPPVASSSAPGT